jgi:parallel beta-helix repeat protein
MKIKTLGTVLISLLLADMAVNFLRITPVVYSQETRRVPTEYSTIQEAIDASNPGDIIYVSKGTYYEHVNVTKDRLVLVGENVSTTIIDGNQTGTGIRILANNVTITGFTIQGSGLQYEEDQGIYVYRSSNQTIVGNIIHDCHVGIRVYDSRNSRIIENTVGNNSDSGIILQVNTRNTFINCNNITNNDYVGINVFAYADNNTISQNTIINNGYCGIQLYLPRWNSVYGNILMFNEFGVRFVGDQTAYNTINDNVIAQNKYGIDFWDNSSSHNVIYHNDIINNTYQLHLETPPIDFTRNLWKNTTNEGNYWSDYEGEDLDGNGIGDTDIPHLGADYYPLDNPRGPIPFLLDGRLFPVTLRSSSVIAELDFSQTSKKIDFKVIGPIGTDGYCNITIPKSLLNPSASQSWVVLLDGIKQNVSIAENATSTSLYFIYKHSTHDVRITVEANDNLIFYIIGTVVLIVLIVGTTFTLMKRKQKNRIFSRTKLKS